MLGGFHCTGFTGVVGLGFNLTGSVGVVGLGRLLIFAAYVGYMRCRLFHVVPLDVQVRTW